MVAYRLVDLVGRASAANILGISLRELDKFVEVYELSSRFSGLRDPGAAITWARELRGLRKKLLTPTVVDAVIDKVRAKRITNSKDLRKLRKVLPDPVAREHFLSREGGLDSAMLRLAPPREEGQQGRAGRRSADGDRGNEARALDGARLSGDIRLLAEADEAYGQMSGPATAEVLRRQFERFGEVRFERLARISSSHIYNLRRSRTYHAKRTVFEKTKPNTVAIGLRKAPQPDGQPGYTRVDTVHQGDRDGRKGIHLVNIVDEVTQYEFVGPWRPSRSAS